MNLMASNREEFSMAERVDSTNRTQFPSASDSESTSDQIEQNPSKRPKVSSIGDGSMSRIAPVLKEPVQTNLITPTRKASQNTDLKSFELLKVESWLVKALRSLSIISPTPIQAKCIPKILEGRDCIGSSRTGSGKTMAFAIPILQKWAEDPMGIYAVVLTPTRELALQIYEQFLAISSSQSLKAVLVIGGSDMRLQALEISKRPHIVIATPGRLADHIRTSGEDTICGLRKVRTVVLDEADRLLSPGPGSMLPDVGECLNIFPQSTDRQTLLFTATMTPEVMTLKGMPRGRGKAEVFVCEVETQVLAIPSTLNQLYMQVPVTQRESFLHILLQTPRNESRSIIVFCNRTSTAQLLHHMLQLLEHEVVSLHSKLAQKLRNQNLARFRASESRILVATDVAARGLDIPEVGLVINYDVPRDPDDYIHRVGRTARAGRKGEAITFVGQRDVKLIHAIEARVGREMAEYAEEKVNVETRVVRDGLRIVNEKKREALLDIEENRDINGRRRRGMRKISGQ